MPVSSRPRVALESTIIAHGGFVPDGLDLGRELEAHVRAGGAEPATIAVIAGQVRVGLNDADLQRIARGGKAVGKAGVADLAVAMAQGMTAATTVSATALLASRAGIRLFATGGIGGVHRGDSGDVSSDLATLARLPIAVVSAGPKALLDLPRTMEQLEALGVLVIGYQTDELPAFYTRTSGIALEHRADEPRQVAAILRQRFDTLALGGVLIANPIPAAAALPGDEIGEIIDRALARARDQGIAGKRLTPFLLAEIAAASGGRALAANRALALANARLAAEIAVCYAAG
jgi:pseudouridylate synthase